MSDKVQVLSDTSTPTKDGYIIGVKGEMVDNAEYKAKWYLRMGYTIEPQINSLKNIAQYCANPTIATVFNSVDEALKALDSVKQNIKPIIGFKTTAYTIEFLETTEVMTIEC